MDTLLRSIGLFFDRLVYSFIPNLYSLFIEVANLSIVSNSAIKAFAGRIYALIGVFMLFKVTFSLITLLVNPDAISDKDKGLSGIVKRVTISLVLLSLVPWLFNFAFEVQNIILEKNVLANIILGGNYGSKVSMQDDPGDAIAYGILASFIQPEDEYAEWATNGNLYKKELEKEPRNQSDMAKAYRKYRDSVEYKDTEILMDIATEKDDNGDFIFNYISFFSTVAGIFACYTFIIYLIQIGFRSVKLSFLQLIAPIPILSYVDPKMSEKTFKSWKDECISTFLDIFVRLIIIYFVILLISLLTKDGVFTMYNWGSDKKADPSLLASAFVIIGLLMFAMEAPKLIPQMLGLKSSGNFSLNPFKALGSAAIPLGLGIGALGAGGLAMAGNVANKINQRKKFEEDLGMKYSDLTDSGDRRAFRQMFRKDYGSTLGSALGGLGSGLFRGGVTGAKNKNGISGALEGAKKSTQRRRARESRMTGINAARNLWTDISGVEGATGTVNENKGRIKANRQEMERLDDAINMYQQAMSHMMGSEGGRYASQFSQVFGNEFTSFGDYLKQMSSTNQDVANKLDTINSSTTLSDAEKSAQINQVLSENNILNEQQFNEFNTLKTNINSTREEYKAKEKENTRLQEAMDMKNKGKK